MAELPFALMAAFFVYNICYPRGCSNFYCMLEILVLNNNSEKASPSVKDSSYLVTHRTEIKRLAIWLVDFVSLIKLIVCFCFSPFSFRFYIQYCFIFFFVVFFHMLTGSNNVFNTLLFNMVSTPFTVGVGSTLSVHMEKMLAHLI